MLINETLDLLCFSHRTSQCQFQGLHNQLIDKWMKLLWWTNVHWHKPKFWPFGLVDDTHWR